MNRTVPQPEHGTPARYRGTRTGSRPPCRCRPCVDAHTRACAERELAHLNGTPLRIPAEVVTAHVHGLMAVGMSCSQISIAAGVSRTSVNNARHGHNPSFNRDIAKKILAVRPCIVRPTDRVPSHGTRRRFQALYVIGHGPVAITAATGLTTTGVQHIVHGTSGVVTAGTYMSARAAYRQLVATPGSSVKAKVSARRHGWAPPTAWGSNIDDPDGVAEVNSPYRPQSANGRDSMRRAEIAHLLSLGESVASIARQMSANEKYIGDLISQGLTAPSYEAAA
jgi:hypothetical protein